ncbi:MAG: hypothetical protein BM557_06245 [Flavobacterium sp. MedPE-SWcel]|uniref:relaxase/mobilization nuclease domain-containing protein n=1 Tax=uncultured Flavobacterium sp. TaxID=165435 RepID=UPI0009101CBB|nr:relaxase/mobilization nuclease domain-containing protein [uncultured Flavobacterium sp.]OIQ19302.1 MAG: hypothetical protein BM557_06245 [Flavobacterium sp. MedPE-SWcel]
MIPRIADRGHSFKGAGLYYLHDKKAKTKERVAWTHTHNIGTNDPELAIKLMAQTAMYKEQLKRNAGVASTGRKSNDKPVYSFSIAWHPEQNPQKDHMLDMALGALEHLGLVDHEAVVVAHSDREHPHVHVITNLVHPEHGKSLSPSYDKLKFSRWAEDYEREHGKIYCEERVINNARRRNGEKIKHREAKAQNSEKIQALYNQAQNTKEFQGLLEQEGYTLAKGNRRGFVLVRQDGQVHSLSRQLKGQRAKDIKAKLTDAEYLPDAQTLSNERQYFYRDDYDAKRQLHMLAAADKAAQKQGKSTTKQTDDIKDNPKKQAPSGKNNNKSVAQELDTVRKDEASKHTKALRKEQQLRAFYKRDELKAQLDAIEAQLQQKKKPQERKKIQEHLDRLQLNLADIDKRMREQGITPQDPTKRDYDNDPVQEPIQPSQPINENELPNETPEQREQRKREALRKQIEQDKKRDKGKDRGLSR